MKNNIDERLIYKLLSKNLKRLRTIQNKSQLSLALSAGLTHNFINDIENCKKGISAKTLAKLSNALGAEPHQFFMPEVLPDNEMQIYMNDFTDNFQKVVKDFSEQYISGSRKKPGI